MVRSNYSLGRDRLIDTLFFFSPKVKDSGFFVQGRWIKTTDWRERPAEF